MATPPGSLADLDRMRQRAVIADTVRASIAERVTTYRLELLGTTLREMLAGHSIRDLMQPDWPAGLLQDTIRPNQLSFTDFIDKEALAGLQKSILARAPQPGHPVTPDDGRGDLIESVRLYVLLSESLRKVAGPDAPQHRREGLASELFARINAYRLIINDEFSRVEHPDIPRIVRDLMMIDILRLLIDTLRIDRLSRDIGVLWRIFARRALTRAGDSIELFLARRDLASRFEAISVMAEVEDLTVLVEQVAAGDREAEANETGNAFLRLLGREAIERFVHLAIAMAMQSLDEGLRQPVWVDAEGEPIADRAARAGRVVDFCTRALDGPVESTLGARGKTLQTLVRDLAAASVHAAARGALPPGDAAADIAALHQLCEKLGWPELADNLDTLLPNAPRQ